jgi:hypothetical protein
MMKAKSPIKFETIEQATAHIEKQKEHNANLTDALIKIAAGEGYYGAQAREYKNIARAAIGEPLL